MNYKIIKQRKAQSEIIGFVMIIVIVAILAVFFLGYYLRQPTERLESKELTNFLSSLTRYTTNCAISYEPNYLNIAGLIKRCYRNKDETCLNEEKVCEMLNNTIKEIMDVSWKDYELKIYYEEESYNNLILSLKEGNCTSFVGAKEYINEGSGNLVIGLRVC